MKRNKDIITRFSDITPGNRRTEWICPHGIGHHQGIHGCDGCCINITEMKETTNDSVESPKDNKCKACNWSLDIKNPECSHEPIKSPKDSNVPESKGNAWKGSKAGISAMHAWIRKHHGTPSVCENTLCEGKSTSFDWCIKTGKAYSHNRKDYLRMCRRCHRMYDMTPDKLAKAIKNLMWSGGKSKTKLNPENLADIRKRLKKGETAMSIAKRYSVDESNILLIKHRKIWKQKSSIEVKS